MGTDLSHCRKVVEVGRTPGRFLRRRDAVRYFSTPTAGTVKGGPDDGFTGHPAQRFSNNSGNPGAITWKEAVQVRARFRPGTVKGAGATETSGRTFSVVPTSQPAGVKAVKSEKKKKNLGPAGCRRPRASAPERQKGPRPSILSRAWRGSPEPGAAQTGLGARGAATPASTKFGAGFTEQC